MGEGCSEGVEHKVSWIWGLGVDCECGRDWRNLSSVPPCLLALVGIRNLC